MPNDFLPPKKKDQRGWSPPRQISIAQWQAKHPSRVPSEEATLLRHFPKFSFDNPERLLAHWAELGCPHCSSAWWRFRRTRVDFKCGFAFIRRGKSINSDPKHPCRERAIASS